MQHLRFDTENAANACSNGIDMMLGFPRHPDPSQIPPGMPPGFGVTTSLLGNATKHPTEDLWELPWDDEIEPLLETAPALFAAATIEERTSDWDVTPSVAMP